MSLKITCKTLKDLDNASVQLLNHFPDSRIFGFYGELGVGKTTFIKYICKKLGVTNIVKSPSFSIINEYATTNEETIYHIDFYRIKDKSEVYDLGYEEYFYSNVYCFIEWAEKIQQLLPEQTVVVNIEENKGIRIIQCQMFDLACRNGM